MHSRMVFKRTERSMARASRTKPSQERQAEILAAASELFAAKGIAETSVDRITEKAGIAKGAFYLHFESKDHVVAKLWEQYLDGFVTIVNAELETLSGKSEWEKFFDRLLEQLVVHALDHAELHRTIYRTADAKALDLCREMNQKTVALIASAVKRGVSAGVVRCDNPDLTTSLVYHGADGLLHDVIFGVRTVNKAELIRTIREFARNALGLNNSKR